MNNEMIHEYEGKRYLIGWETYGYSYAEVSIFKEVDKRCFLRPWKKKKSWEKVDSFGGDCSPSSIYIYTLLDVCPDKIKSTYIFYFEKYIKLKKCWEGSKDMGFL